jgi:phospholipid-translocating P-type ATPase (flippase)
MSRSVKASVLGLAERGEDHEYPSNRILTAYPSLFMFIPISVVRQYTRPLSLYFLIIGFLLFIKEISPYDPFSQLVPVFLVLSISVFRETMQELARQREDKRLNFQKTRVNRLGTWTETNWEDIMVGDVVMVGSDCPAPADLVMVASSTTGNTAYIQTTNLDGETNYKSRSGIDKAVVAIDMMTTGKLTGERRAEIIIHAEAPRSDLDWFEGQAVFQFADPEKERALLKENASEDGSTTINSTKSKTSTSEGVQVERLSIRNFIPREAVVKGTDWIIGVAVYTGTDTKVMLGNERPAYKTSKIDRMTDKLVVVILFLQFSLSIFVGVAGGLTSSTSKRWWLDLALSKSHIARGVLDGLACVILITQMIPISLIISLEIAKVYQAKFMESDVAMPGMHANSQALNDDLGQIGYVLSDKTGTLTSNELVLKVATVNGKAYPDLSSLRSAAKTNPHVALFVDAVGMCHDVSPTWSNDVLAKNTAPSQSITGLRKEAKKHHSEMEQSSGNITPMDQGGKLPLGMSYCGASPDEICFVTACAESFGRVLHKRSHGEMVFTDHNSEGRPVELVRKILRMFEFDNARRRSSIAILTSDTTVTVFVKGSDDGMLSRCRSETEEEKRVLTETEASLQFYAKQSLRTLVFAAKTMSKSEWDALVAKHNLDDKALMEEVESNLSLVACTGTEDRLQDGVQGSIERMRIAGISVWMITGDKLDTAIEISKSANLIAQGMKIVSIDLEDATHSMEKLEALEEQLLVKDQEVAAVVTGRSIRHYIGKTDRFIEALLKCKSVVVCRSTKDQKAQMVELVQNAVKGDLLVLAIGDGANDVPMIKKADVGIGIAGKEGRQAAQNADYTITQFSHLDRMLLFHGRLNYVRTCKMVLYFLFKNLVLCLPFVIHSAIVTMYSSAALISSSMGLSFNTFLTGLPVFALGLLERDVSPDDHLVGFNGIKAQALAQAYPKLYMTGRNNHMFGRYLLGSMFVASVLTGCWIYLNTAGPLVTTAVSWKGWTGDHWGVSDVYFFCVFLVDTAAVLVISEGVTWPMALTLIYSFIGAVMFLVSNAYDASNSGGFSMFELLKNTILLVPVIVISVFPPVMMGIAAKNWKYRFDPTARMIWQEAKERADQRRSVLKKIDSSPRNMRTKLTDQYKSVLRTGASVFFRPEEIDQEVTAPLVDRETHS